MHIAYPFAPPSSNYIRYVTLVSLYSCTVKRMYSLVQYATARASLACLVWLTPLKHAALIDGLYCVGYSITVFNLEAQMSNTV